MTVEELKAALKKRKLKGLTGMKREQLVEKLKKEVKSQRTLGGGGGRRMTLGKVGEEKGGEKVQDKVVRLEEKEESEGGDEEAKRIRSRSEDKKEGGATKVSREVQGEDERHETKRGGAAKEENVLEEEMIRMKLEEEEEEGVEKVQDEGVRPGGKDRGVGGDEEEERSRSKEEDSEVGGAIKVEEEPVKTIETGLTKSGRTKRPRLSQQVEPQLQLSKPDAVSYTHLTLPTKRIV